MSWLWDPWRPSQEASNDAAKTAVIVTFHLRDLDICKIEPVGLDPDDLLAHHL